MTASQKNPGSSARDFHPCDLTLPRVQALNRLQAQSAETINPKGPRAR